MSFLKKLAFALARNDTKRAAVIMWRMRERIAVAIASGHARVVAAINRVNYLAPRGIWGI